MMNFISNDNTATKAISVNSLPSIFIPTCKPPVSRKGVVYRQKQLTRPSSIEFSLLAVVSQANSLNMDTIMLSFEQLSHVSNELFGFDLFDAKNPSASKRESKISSRILRWAQDKMENQKGITFYDNALEINIVLFAAEYPVVLPFNGILFSILDSILVQPTKSLIKDIRKENVAKGFINTTPVKRVKFNARMRSSKSIHKAIWTKGYKESVKAAAKKTPAKVIKKTAKK